MQPPFLAIVYPRELSPEPYGPCSSKNISLLRNIGNISH